jgi:hypothetical protein
MEGGVPHSVHTAYIRARPQQSLRYLTLVILARHMKWAHTYNNNIKIKYSLTSTQSILTGPKRTDGFKLFLNERQQHVSDTIPSVVELYAATVIVMFFF